MQGLCWIDPPLWMESTRACSEWMCAVNKWTDRNPGSTTQSRQIHGHIVEICQPPGNVRGHLEVVHAALPTRTAPPLPLFFLLSLYLSVPSPSHLLFVTHHQNVNHQWVGTVSPVHEAGLWWYSIAPCWNMTHITYGYHMAKAFVLVFTHPSKEHSTKFSYRMHFYQAVNFYIVSCGSVEAEHWRCHFRSNNAIIVISETKLVVTWSFKDIYQARKV